MSAPSSGVGRARGCWRTARATPCLDSVKLSAGLDTVNRYARAVDLMGLTEIAEMLGVSRQRIDQLAHTDDFPEPVAELAAGRIWERADVEAWARATGRLR